MAKRYAVVEILFAIAVTFIFFLCLSCDKDYRKITAEDFIVNNIPTDWSVTSKDEIAKAQEMEEKSMGSDTNRVMANVLFSAGLDRGNGNSYPHVVIEVIPLGDFKNLNEVMVFNESIRKDHFKGYQRVNLEYATNPNGDSTMAILMYQYYGNNDLLLMTLNAWVLNRSVVWQVGCSSLASEFQKDAGTYSNILNSFVIKDGNVSLGKIDLR